jgi:hypothetical protein
MPLIPLVLANIFSAIGALVAVVELVTKDNAGAAVAGCWLLALCVANATHLMTTQPETD